MWDHDWALLGIEPTTELAAIKKAYALKLKTTRPDDDADAYQALRAAYERVQLWLKWRREQPPAEEEPTQAPTIAPPPTVPVAIQASEPDATWTPTPADPQTLIDDLQARWRKDGVHALTEQWLLTRALLEAQPLASRAATSAHFAHWVLQHPALPDALVAEMAAYFEWLGDFRVERQLGTALAHALQEALRERVEAARPPSPGQQAQAQPLLKLKQLRQQGRSGLRLLLGLVLQPMLRPLMEGLGPRTLGLLGLDLDDRRALASLATTAWLCRMALLPAVAFPIFAFRLDFLDDAVYGWLAWLTLAGVLLGMSHYLGMFMNYGFSLLREGSAPLALPLLRWRRHRWQPMLGLSLLATATVLGGFSAQLAEATTPLITSAHLRGLAEWAWWMSPWLLSLIAALLAWPLTPTVGTLCMGLALPLLVMLCRMVSNDVAWSACAAATLLFVLTGAATFEDRLPLRRLLSWVCWPVFDTLALGARGDWWFGMMPTLLALAQVMSQVRQGTLSGVGITWVLATLALGFGQRRLEAWALARLSRA